MTMPIVAPPVGTRSADQELAAPGGQVPVPARRAAWTRGCLRAGAFLLPFLVSIAMHWSWLGYGVPFGGQQSDDDYHYYGFAARLDAPHPRHLRAYQPDVRPDLATDDYDAARVKISFSEFWPYPGWAVALHQVARIFGLSYPMAAFVLFLVQSALALFGAQRLAEAMAPPGEVLWWRFGAGLAMAGFLGVDGVASPLLSIPMNMATALALAALGVLVSQRWPAAAGLLILAVTVHVAAITLAGYVLITSMLYGFLNQPQEAWPAIAARTGVTAALVIGVWATLHYGVLDMGRTGLGEGVRIGFDRARLSFLMWGQGGFFPLVGGAGLLACWCAARQGQGSWRLPVACLIGLALTGVGFLVLGNRYVHHYATLHPLSRLLYYMAPGLLVLVTLLAAARAVCSGAAVLVRGAALACALITLIVVARQGGLVWVHQFAPRQAAGLGPLHARLSQLSTEPTRSETGFVFFRHEFGTVLSAAHLYDGRYLWAKAYSPERLREAAAACQRLVYLEGPGDPPFRVPGFCPVSEETISLGSRSGQSSAATVRLVQAQRC